MLRGQKCLTPWVDLRCHQYPENELLAGLGWGFHPKITLQSQQKTGVQNWLLCINNGSRRRSTMDPVVDRPPLNRKWVLTNSTIVLSMWFIICSNSFTVWDITYILQKLLHTSMRTWC